MSHKSSFGPSCAKKARLKVFLKSLFSSGTTSSKDEESCLQDWYDIYNKETKIASIDSKIQYALTRADSSSIQIKSLQLYLARVQCVSGSLRCVTSIFCFA
jgi:hypothetical protein